MKTLYGLKVRKIQLAHGKDNSGFQDNHSEAPKNFSDELQKANQNWGRISGKKNGRHPASR